MPKPKKQKRNITGLRNQGSLTTDQPSTHISNLETLMESEIDLEEECTNILGSLRINWDKDDDVGMGINLDAELDSDQDYEMDDEEGLESMRTMATEMSCDYLDFWSGSHLMKLNCRGEER